MEKFRLFVIGISCIALLICVGLLNFSQINSELLIKAQTSSALIMITFLVIHSILEEKDAGNNH